MKIEDRIERLIEIDVGPDLVVAYESYPNSLFSTCRTQSLR